MIRRSVLLLICLCLSSCGFHLRGYRPLPTALRVMHLESTRPNSEFSKTLLTTLREDGIRMVPDSKGVPVLTVIDEIKQAAPGSMSPTNQTREYQLSVTVEYQLADATGKLIQLPRTITSRRTLLLNTSRILGSTNEEALMYTEMYRDVSMRLIDQLSSRKISRALNAPTQSARKIVE